VDHHRRAVVAVDVVVDAREGLELAAGPWPLIAGFLLVLVGLRRAGTSLDQKLHEFGIALAPVHYGDSSLSGR
jgi:hypothetical protein